MRNVTDSRRVGQRAGIFLIVAQVQWHLVGCFRPPISELDAFGHVELAESPAHSRIGGRGRQPFLEERHQFTIIVQIGR